MQASGATADFERGVAGAESLEVEFQALDQIVGGGKELFVVLFAPPEGDVIVGVFAGALVPIGAHALQYFGVIHLALLF